MNCNCGSKNQTSEDSLKAFCTSENIKGTGLFLLPAPDKGILERQVVVVTGLSFSECAKRGIECLAFKWIADSVMDSETVLKTRKDDPCKGVACAVGISCPGVCICDVINGVCI